MKPLRLTLVLLGALIVGVGVYLAIRQRPSQDLKSMYERHRWFQLRDAVVDPPTTLFGGRREAPSFYRAAVAYAFHDFAAAEKLASEAIRSAPGLFEVLSAHVILLSTYGQEGRYREALSESQFLLAKAQDNPDLKSWTAFYATAMLLQPMSVAHREFSQVPWSIEAGHLSIPVSMNGREAHYGVDTGADFSTISEAEAGRLGLQVHEVPGFRWKDGFGHAIAARIAWADELDLGGFRLKNVLFIVLREPPAWAALPVARQGTLGRNVLMELETVRWKRDGWLEFGFPAAPASLRDANVCFDGWNLVADAVFQNSKVYVLLDSGANETAFLPEFHKDFPLVAASSDRLTQRGATVGGSFEMPVAGLPELTLHMGGAALAIKGAALRPKTGFAPWFHVWAGVDLLLLKDTDTRLDLGAMRLTYE